MAGLGLVEDTYNLRARLAPSVIVFLPIMLAVTSWWPGEAKWPGVLAGMGTSLALGTLLSQFGRDLGKEKQRKLFQRWGGVPTTQLLSHRTSTLNPHTLARCHEALRQLRPDLRIPGSKEDEAADLAAADAAYTSCTDTLRELSRDKAKYPLVFEENVNFGFRRNLWAMKPAAVVIAAGSAIVCFGRLAATLTRERDRALLFLTLATLRTDVALFDDVGELQWKGPTDGFDVLSAQFDAAITESRRPSGRRK